MFFMHKDVISQQSRQAQELRPYEVCVTAAVLIGERNVEGAQNVHGIWRIYVNSRESRVELLTKGLALRHKNIPLFEKNPKSTNNDNPGVKAEKITIKDMPLSMDNNEIEVFLACKDGVILTSTIRDAHERNDDGELTHYKNGDRFVYAQSPIMPVLPRFVEIAGRSCRIYHQSQREVCRVCGEHGHKHDSELCKAYKVLDAEVFQTFEHVLSNSYPYEVRFQGRNFKSAEHAYQYSKAADCGYHRLTTKIEGARHAGVAKAISSNGIPEEEGSQWEQKHGNVMMDILTAKYQQCPEFQEALKASGDRIILQATRDKFWGTGLSPEISKHTTPEFWPGKNMLGAMLAELREMFREPTITQLSPEVLEELTTPMPMPPDADVNQHVERGRTPSRVESNVTARLRREASPSPMGRRTSSLPPNLARRRFSFGTMEKFVTAHKRKAVTSPESNKDTKQTKPTPPEQQQQQPSAEQSAESDDTDTQDTSGAS